MAQVIIYENENGNVSVCVPTGELPIEQVKTKDTPSHSIIIEDSELPQGDDAAFFDAWVLNDSVVSVDIAKAKSPLEWLLSRELIVPTSESTVVVPREVSLALRNGQLLREIKTKADLPVLSNVDSLYHN